VTRDELVGIVASRAEVDAAEADRTIRALIDVIRDRASEGQVTTISSFAKFTPVHRRARQIRNPRTGDLIQVPDRFAVRITPSPAFVKAAGT
jgi:DNA-binding protein HU-beta